MQIQINDESIHVSPEDSLATAIENFCDQHRIDPQQVAVAQHDCVIPRSKWSVHKPDQERPYTLFIAVAGG